MRKYIFLSLLILPLLLPSCVAEIPEKGRDIYLVSVADDFYGLSGSRRKLSNVITDQAALIGQISTLGSVRVKAYVSQDGKRYVSDNPRYRAVDREGTVLTDPSSPSFSGFRYIPGEDEEEYGWDMLDVMSYISSLNLGATDILIFTFSGHGEKESGALVTNAGEMDRTWKSIGPEDVMDVMESIGGKKILFIDSCYSGSFIPHSSFTDPDSFSGEMDERWNGTDYPGHIWETLTSRKGKGGKRDIWVMASASRGQEASDSLSDNDSPFQPRYGAFTYYLLKGLGYDTMINAPTYRDGRITFYGLYSFIRSSFPLYESEIQTPRASMNALDIVIRE